MKWMIEYRKQIKDKFLPMFHIDVLKIFCIYKREDLIGMLRMHVLCPLSSSAQLVS